MLGFRSGIPFDVFIYVIPFNDDVPVCVIFPVLSHLVP